MTIFAQLDVCGYMQPRVDFLPASFCTTTPGVMYTSLKHGEDQKNESADKTNPDNCEDSCDKDSNDTTNNVCNKKVRRYIRNSFTLML